MKKDNLLSIGQFARAAYLSHKALRIYDQQDLLKPDHIDPETGYRYYNPEQLPTARFIRQLRQIDMSLNDIQKILTAEQEDVPTLLKEHLQMIEARYDQVRTTIVKLLTRYNMESKKMAFDVTSKNIEPQQVLSINKHIYISELKSHMQNSFEEIKTIVEAQGGQIVAKAFGIYHGPVNQEDNGPMEVCVPVSGAFEVSGNIVAKELASDQVATLTITDEQCHFPAILDAYDAMHDWITSNGHTIAGSPREVWTPAPGVATKIELIWPYQEKA